MEPRNGDEDLKKVSAQAHETVLNSASGPVFDDIIGIAALICEAPMALISLVEDERVWVMAGIGFETEELPRELSFCAHGIQEPDLFVIPDATKDERFKANPLVIDEPGIRFYAGAPLRDVEGTAFGMVCVMDRQPRQLHPFQEQALRALARLVVRELEFLDRSVRLRELEGEAANAHAVRSMAARLLHELGNAVVPLSTHQQLLSERYHDPDFRRSLDATLSEAVRRVLRLVSQMRHLAQVSDHASELVSVKDIVEEAYRTASRTPGIQPGRLLFESGSDPIVVRGDFAALTDAFGEIILNALQANPSNPEVSVHCSIEGTSADDSHVVIEVSDNGKGFDPETMKDAMQPFFGTRSVGPGLGLAVAKQVIQRHNGSLEIVPPRENREGAVRIHLPLQDGA